MATYFRRKRRSAWQRLGVRNIKNEHHWSHRLKDHQRMGSGFDPLSVLVQPTVGRRNEPSPWHLNVNQHCVIGSIEPKSPHEFQQFVIRFSGVVLVGKPEKLVQRTTSYFLVYR
jgi:hypothetical protein